MIRAAKLEDAGRMATLVRACCAELEEQHGAIRATELIVGAMGSALREGQTLFVAEEGDQIVGVCLWIDQPGLEDCVAGLGTYVHGAFRRRGLSSELREKAENHWAMMARKWVTGTVASTNEAGLESSLKRGFKVVGLEVRKALGSDGE